MGKSGGHLSGDRPDIIETKLVDSRFLPGNNGLLSSISIKIHPALQMSTTHLSAPPALGCRNSQIHRPHGNSFQVNLISRAR